MSITIVGFTADDRVPGVARETIYGGGRVSIGSIPARLLITGNKLSTGTATANQDITQILSEDDADLYYGAGSEISIQAYHALKIPGVNLYGAPVSEAVGGVAGTCRVLISGTWSTTGQLTFWLHDRAYSVGVNNDDTAATVATLIQQSFGSNARGPVTPSVTSTSSTGQVTLTTKSLGARGNDYVLAVDDSYKPSGMDVTLIALLSLSDVTPSLSSYDFVTLSGTPVDGEKNATYVATMVAGGLPTAGTVGASFSLTRNSVAVTALAYCPTGTGAYTIGTTGITMTWGQSAYSAGVTYTWTVDDTDIHYNMTKFANASGVDDVATVVIAVKSERFQYQAWAQNDTTNIAAIKSYLNSEAGATIKHTGHAIFAQNGLQATAVSLAQSTCNHARMSVLWMLYGETYPAAISAVAAAYRAVVVPINPNTNYDDIPLPDVLPQRWKSDRAKHATLKAALNSGLTPLMTNPDNTVTFCRAIVSKSLTGTLPDYRTYDWPDADVPDRISDEVEAEWGSYKLANPYIGPEPAAGQRKPPEGRGQPSTWNSTVTANIMRKAEKNNWVIDVDNNLPQTEWSESQKCFLTAIPTVVCPIAHQLGASIRQIAF